jgi:hypothetical protein
VTQPGGTCDNARHLRVTEVNEAVLQAIESHALVERRLAEWRRMLRGNTTQGRAVLQRVLNGRIVFTPSGQGYRFEAPTPFSTSCSAESWWHPGPPSSSRALAGGNT